MPRLALSVRDFVQPLEARGDLDASLTFQLEEDAALQGIRLHTKVQQRLAQTHPGAMAERPIQYQWETQDVPFQDFQCWVRGRLDLLIPGKPPILEEIKTTYQAQRLMGALEEDALHPFAQQLRMYAWMLTQETGEIPHCRLRVISLLDESEMLLELPFDPEGFGLWVKAQVLGHFQILLQLQARARERRHLGEALHFPFAPLRPGQEPLIALVDEALGAKQRLLVQAPTGLGKTAAVLFPALKKALLEDLRVFYLTPRNSQHGVAEAFVHRMRDLGHPVRSMTLRAKERVCPQEQVHCSPEICPRAKGYYDRLKESQALDQLKDIGCADASTLHRLAELHTLCPFELALDGAKNADIIIGDYNYAFSPSSRLQRFFGEGLSRKNILLVDEAHNLPERAASWFSPALELDALHTLKKAWKGKRTLHKSRFLRQLGRCINLLSALTGDHRAVSLDAGPWYQEELKIRKLLAQAAGDGFALGPEHPLVQLFRSWMDFCRILRDQTEAHFLTWIPPGKLQFTCVEASDYLAECFSDVAGAVLFSGTLKPFEIYARLSGLQATSIRWEEIPSPFPSENRCLLIVPQVSTLFRHRIRQAPRIADFLSRVLPLRHGNYLVFFPSFEFLDLIQPHLDLQGFRILAQPRRATQEALGRILDSLRQEQGWVVLAVMGGSLSEGIDLPGEALIGSVVVGPPLPPFDLERKLSKDYFDRKLGEGEQIAYICPAMAKAVQAAGRVIRGPSDRGLLIFLDGRFLEPAFARCFPSDWFPRQPMEAVSQSILEDIRQFWGRKNSY